MEEWDFVSFLNKNSSSEEFSSPSIETPNVPSSYLLLIESFNSPALNSSSICFLDEDLIRHGKTPFSFLIISKKKISAIAPVDFWQKIQRKTLDLSKNWHFHTKKIINILKRQTEGEFFDFLIF